MVKKSLKGTWPQALATFIFPIVLILALRWVIAEPFVIPSSSMVPNLLIHDHILVLKSSMGLRLPFSDLWIAKWKEPQPGDVLVFKYPENPNIYYIKRLIGRPGDTVEVRGDLISVNGREWSQSKAQSLKADEPGFDYFIESSGQESHRIRFYSDRRLDSNIRKTYKVPTDHFFFMGDNRDQSSDGRVWGFVPSKYLVGHAWLIWLSCEQTLVSASYICDFSTLRPERMFKLVK